MTNLCRRKDGASWLKGLLFVALLIAAQASTAATVIVTQTEDVPPGQSPIFGSLRDAIRNRASPGDTIVFQVRGPITLLDDLVIPRELAGLTLQGRAVIQVRDGLAAVRWYKTGQIDKIIEYCKKDVQVTRDLYEFGKQNGYVQFLDRSYRVRKVPVRW